MQKKSNTIVKVDIVIPSKDRSMQLHLLLESMNKYIKGMGRITITYQSSSNNFRKGYELLKKRVLTDVSFSNLRENSDSIVFRSRKSLPEAYDAFMDSGDSDYIMPLIDDEVFIRDYNLINDAASKYFFANDEVLACAIRLGDNLSDQLSWTLDDGVFYDNPRGHANSLLSNGKPRFISPILGHEISESIMLNYKKQEYLLWEWPANLNVPHWSCIFSTTAHLYRKSLYLKMYEMFGRDSFMEIEYKGFEYLKKQYLKKVEKKSISSVIYYFLFFEKYFNRFEEKIIGERFGFTKYGIFEILLFKILCRGNLLSVKNIPHLMVSPRKSVSVNVDYDSSHFRPGDKKIGATLNSYYLSGKIFRLDEISSMDYFFPKQYLMERSYREYNSR